MAEKAKSAAGKREEYEASKAKYDGMVNVYRTPPDDSNLMHNFQCMTIMQRNNADIRNYLLTNSKFNLEDLPHDAGHDLKYYEPWRENVHPHKAFFYFDMLFDGASNIKPVDDEFKEQETKLSKLKRNGYVFLRNFMGREWDDYEKHEARREAEFNISQEEFDERRKKINNTATEIAYLLEKEQVERSGGFPRVLLSWLFWIRKKTVYKGIEMED